MVKKFAGIPLKDSGSKKLWGKCNFCILEKYLSRHCVCWSEVMREGMEEMVRETNLGKREIKKKGRERERKIDRER